MAAVRRRKMIGRKRRVEDEEGGPDQIDLDDDSLTEGSIGTDDGDNDADSDTSNLEDASPVGTNARKSKSSRNGAPKQPAPSTVNLPDNPAATDTQAMMQGLSVNDGPEDDKGTHFDDAASITTQSKPAPKGPLVVSSSSANRQPGEPQGDRRRREHEEYKRKRDEDPAFVPNRGAFFMHDHRHAGPAANGFRPFGRGRGGGRGGRGGGAIGGTYAPFNPYHQSSSDPLTSGQWAHDMHEAVTEPPAARQPRHIPDDQGLPNGNGYIPQCAPNSTPINRTMSTEKQLGKVQVKVYLPVLGKEPVTTGAMSVKQYTKLPDHRPPLRRDKPVRISLPDHSPKYIYPAVDRSFIFIPRAMRPNQQRGPRGKPRSGLGSMGGFSRRTSVFGGSYYGSAYSPSIALSRRSSLAPDGRDYMFSPTGSVVSRPPMPIDQPRPVVRLPPTAQHLMQPPAGPAMMVSMEQPLQALMQQPMPQGEQHNSTLPVPQDYALPQGPAVQENRTQPVMHQPRPQKTVSVADIETPSLHQQPFDQAFHQQMPVQVSNGMAQDSHARRPSYPTQHSAGTPVSHIPERAIHAAPFQPNPYQQQQQQQQQQQPQGYYGQSWGMMQPQQGYYYPPQFSGNNMSPAGSAAPFVPASQQGQGQAYSSHAQNEQAPPQYGQQGQPGMMAQEVNGMVYYYDPTQMPQMNPYSGYQQPAPSYGGSGVPGMAGMVTPSPDGLYYPQQGQGMMYYPQ